MRLALLSLSLETLSTGDPRVDTPKYEPSTRRSRTSWPALARSPRISSASAPPGGRVGGAPCRTAGADVLVIVLQSYHPSLNSLSALMRTSLPILIWNTQNLLEVGPDYGFDALTENHGMHGGTGFV